MIMKKEDNSTLKEEDQDNRGVAAAEAVELLQEVVSITRKLET